VSEPRPEPDSEIAGEPEYGNDSGFAAEATGPAAGPAGAEDADDDPGRGAD
jgi:hypothetical protein